MGMYGRGAYSWRDGVRAWPRPGPRTWVEASSHTLSCCPCGGCAGVTGGMEFVSPFATARDHSRVWGIG